MIIYAGSGWSKLLLFISLIVAGFFFLFIALQAFFEGADTRAELTSNFANPADAKEYQYDHQDDD